VRLKSERRTKEAVTRKLRVFSVAGVRHENFQTYLMKSNKILRLERQRGEPPRGRPKKELRGVECISSAKGVADPKISDSPKAEQDIGMIRQNTISAEQE